MTNERKATKRLFALFTIVLLFITLFPVFWVVKMSFTPNKEILSAPATIVPSSVTLTNYLRVLGFVDSATAVKLGGSGQKINFFGFLFNSILVSTIVTVSQVLFCAAGAYAFARFRFPFRKAVFGIYVAALMVPGIVTTIPNFILMRQLGWLNTYMGIMAPALLMTPFAVFFLRQFFLGINKELEEAAFLDGAGKLTTFVRVVLPISRTSLATLAIITFINQWNDYLWPLIVGKSEKVRLLTVALGVFRSQTPQGSPDWGGLMAGTTMAIVPTMILFLIFGKRIVNSINFTGFR
jgi:multiple sugar transport system permease protein